MVNDKEVAAKFSDLPVEIYSEITRVLPPTDIFRFCGTNRTIRSYLLSDTLLWQTLLGIHFQPNPYNPLPISGPFTYRQFLVSYLKTYSHNNGENVERVWDIHIPLISAIKMGDTQTAIEYIKKHKTDDASLSDNIHILASLAPFHSLDLFELAIALRRTELINFIINEYGLFNAYHIHNLSNIHNIHIHGLLTIQNFCEAIVFSKPIPTNLHSVPQKIIEHNFYALMSMACMHRCLPAVIELVRPLPDINTAFSSDVMTPLMIACEYDDIASINYLLDHGATDFRSVGLFSVTALSLACKRNSLSAIKALIAHEAKIKEQLNNSGALLLAVATAGIEVINALLQAGASIGQDIDVAQKLLHAGSIRSPEIIQLLVDHGVPVDCAAEDGTTPVINACFNGHFAAFKALIDNGADISSSLTQLPLSLLQLSILNLDSEICRYILRNTNASFHTLEIPIKRILDEWVVYHDRDLQKELLEKYLHDFIDQRIPEPDQAIHINAAQSLLTSIRQKARLSNLTELLEASSDNNLIDTHYFVLKENFLLAEPSLTTTQTPLSPKLSAQNATLFKKRRLQSSSSDEVEHKCLSNFFALN